MPSLRLLLLSLLIHYAYGNDWFCGRNWLAASMSCNAPCPTTQDSECSSGEECHGFTGCEAKLNAPPTPPPTPNPTRRTKRPTQEPTTAAPTVTAMPSRITPPPTLSPEGPPTAAPIIRPQLIEVDTVQSDETILSVEAQRSYGLIFDVQTIGDVAISILNLEFYSPVLGANVAYEVWTKPNTWHGYEGQVRQYTKIHAGNVTTSKQAGEFTRLPAGMPEIKLDGRGMRQSIYLSLSTKDMVYAMSTSKGETQSVAGIADLTKPTMDTVILAQTPELLIFEGAAVMVHPFEKAQRRIHYRMPRGFVGRIYYHRAPCEDIPVTITDDEEGTSTEEWRKVQRWDQCVTTKPPVPMPSVAGRMPSMELGGDDGGGWNKTAFNGTMPSVSPTISSPPTIDMAKVNLIITVQNVAKERMLTREEQTAFEKATLDFYERQELLDVNEVELYGAKLHYQQLFADDDEEKKKRPRKRSLKEDKERRKRPRARVLQEEMVGPVPQDPADVEEIEEETSLASLEATLIVSVLYSPLPLQITQELLQTLILNNPDEYIQSLKDAPELSSYMSTVDVVPSVLAVDILTDPPTRRPTGAPTPYVAKIDGDSGPSGGTVFGIIFLLLWFSLTACAICKINHARKRMRIEMLKRKFMEEGGDANQSATALVGHGMVYEEETKAPSREEGGLRASLQRMKTARNLFSRSVKGSMNGMTNGTAKGARNLMVEDCDYDEEKKGYSDDEERVEEAGHNSQDEDENMSSMEDSYYSEEESDYSSGSDSYRR